METFDPYPDGMLRDALELGAITDRSVRVWSRQTEEPVRSIRLMVHGREPVTAEVNADAASDWTGAATVSLPEPAPGCAFELQAGQHVRQSRLAPSPEDHGGFTFAFGSCNSPFRLDASGQVRTRAAVRIYPEIQADLAVRDARFLVLIGDQLYAEGLPRYGVRAGLTDDQPVPADEELLARYRRVTRGYFGEPRFRSLRESIPTLCMWDDHDIFDNWGSRREESPLDRALFRAAARTFSDYQFARNAADHPPEPPFDTFYRYGTAGFLLLDIRGARSYEEGRLLGSRQWQRLLDFLNGPASADLHTLFVTTSVPVAHAALWFAMLGEHVPGAYGTAVRDRWSSSAFRASRDEFLDALFRWQDRAPHRQAILLGGDIHEAESARIFRRGDTRPISQFTSSALTTRHGGKARLFQYVATRMPNLFERRYRFERDFLEPRNNAGVVRLERLPEGGHRVTFTVRAWEPDQRRLVDARTVVTMPGGQRPVG